MTREQLIEHLRKSRCKPSVVARVLKLNPNGATDGVQLRGWHRKVPLWVHDLIGPKQFIAKHGVEAYRFVDRAWWKWNGRRKAMRKTVYLDNVWRRAQTRTERGTVIIIPSRFA